MNEIKVSGSLKGVTNPMMTGYRHYSFEFRNPEELDLFLEEHKDELLHFDIRTAKRESKRSLSANAYAWVLIDQIARKTRATKEEVYREEIRKTGTGEVLCMPEKAVPTFVKQWSSKGLGFLVERIGPRRIIRDDGHLEHWEEVLAIYGSSTFTTSEMSYFIDCIIQDAKALGIPVMSDSEIALMKEEWT